MKLLTTVIQGSFVQQHTWIWFKKNYLRFKELFKVYLTKCEKTRTHKTRKLADKKFSNKLIRSLVQ